MKIYRWNSQALQQYSFGDIIVIADNLKDAKVKALKLARLYFANYYIMQEFCGEGDIKTLDQLMEKLKSRHGNEYIQFMDGYADYINAMRYVRNDLKNEPKIYNEGFCIQGGE